MRTYATAGELSEGTSSFWTDIDIKDLPGSDVDAEVLRRHNTSFPFYRKQVVVGKVIGVERDHVAIYTGERLTSHFHTLIRDLRQADLASSDITDLLSAYRASQANHKRGRNLGLLKGSSMLAAAPLGLLEASELYMKVAEGLE